ncbi:SMC5-SMC6 complex localization factor protein [Trichinella pseudospiralis]
MFNCLKSRKDQRIPIQKRPVSEFATGKLTEETEDSDLNRLCFLCPEQDTSQLSVNVCARDGNRLLVRKVPSLQRNWRTLKQSRRFPLSQKSYTVASHVNLVVKDQHDYQLI